MKGSKFRAAILLSATLAGAGCGPSAPAGAGADLASLAQSAAGFAQARPGRPLEFPRDHGAHPEYRIEWWYLTANLQDAEARAYGAQWTLFRYAVRPPGTWTAATAWQNEQVFMAHLAITTPDGHAAFQRYARGGDHGGPHSGPRGGILAQAGARAQPFAAWLDDWRLYSVAEAPGTDTADAVPWLPLQLEAQQDGYAVNLRLESAQAPILQGDGGFSQKHPGGGGSHYYSQPFLAASGTLRVDGVTVPVSGQAWLDREWSSQFLQAGQVGWDWFALHLDSGEKLMLFRLRSSDGAGDYRHAVLLGADGSRLALEPMRIHLEVLQETAIAGRSLPLHWRIDLPEIGRSLAVEALHPAQWLDVDFPYWEGVVRVRGADPRNRGEGYLELTGYPAR